MNGEAAEKLLELIGEVKRTAKDCGFAERGYDILSQKEKEEALTKAAQEVKSFIAAETEGASSAVNEPQLKEALESFRSRKYPEVLLVLASDGSWEIYRNESIEYAKELYFDFLSQGHATISGAIAAAQVELKKRGE